MTSNVYFSITKINWKKSTHHRVYQERVTHRVYQGRDCVWEGWFHSGWYVELPSWQLKKKKVQAVPETALQ